MKDIPSFFSTTKITTLHQPALPLTTTTTSYSPKLQALQETKKTMSPTNATTAQVFDNGVIKQASELKTGDKVFLAPTDRNKDVILDAIRPFLDESKLGKLAHAYMQIHVAHPIVLVHHQVYLQCTLTNI
jgi:hypothetical protein